MEIADKFTAMNKAELRAACKDFGITYGKLTVGGMRDELRAVAALASEEDNFENSTADVAAQIDYATASYDEVRASNCPHCGVPLDNGLLSINDEAANSSKTVYEAGQQTHEWSCMGCNGEFGKDYGPYVAPVAAPRAPVQKPGSGLQIEKNRERKNGVTRPSIGGVCRAVWDFCDAVVAEG
jgi:hypothetical protein